MAALIPVAPAGRNGESHVGERQRSSVRLLERFAEAAPHLMQPRGNDRSVGEHPADVSPADQASPGTTPGVTQT